MSAEELAARAGRRLRFGAERIGLVGNGVTVDNRWRLVPALENLPAPERLRATVDGHEQAAGLRADYLNAADDLRRGRFSFFGRTFELGMPPAWNTDPLTGTVAPLRYGKTLDYRDTRVVGNAKHLWELNRHLELVLLAQAYRLSDDHAYLLVLRELLSSWIDQCPYLKGPNWCSSLELGIRLINWHLLYGIAGGQASPLFAGTEGRRFRDAWLKSIYQHNYFVMHHLSTYPSSANNHLIGELAGVFVACCTWPCWPITGKWKEQARAMLQREISRQTHGDGVNKEQTTWYQQFVASLFLVAGIAGQRAGVSFEPGYWEQIEKMLTFLSAIMDAGGTVPMIGDADDGLAFALEPRNQLDPFRSLLGIGAAVFADQEWARQSEGAGAAAAWLCAGLEPVQRRAEGSTSQSGRSPRRPVAFSEGGYYLLGRDLGQPKEIRALVDAGPLGFLSIAGHGHADCLSVTLSAAGREQLVDTGTYAYHSGKEWRDYFRSTAAHNTVRVDGVDQSQIGGPFLWLEKAECTVHSYESEAGHDLLEASHTGYLRLPDPVRHSRRIRFDKSSAEFEIVDRFACNEAHVVERFWHFAESCEVELQDGGAVSFDGSITLRLEVDERDATAILLRGCTDPISGWISRGFNRKSPTTTLVFRDEITGEAVLRTRIRLESSVLL